jgi:hypothetical protein
MGFILGLLCRLYVYFYNPHILKDDIVFAELTVKENLMFSGKFRLPLGTTQSEIEATANEALVNLGLVRIANSIVGDVSFSIFIFHNNDSVYSNSSSL